MICMHMFAVIVLYSEMSAACTQDTCNTSDASSAFSGSALNTSGGVQKKVLIGNLVPSTLLSRSATEFDLQCETDADYERSAKRPRHDVRTTAVAGRATDSVSGGILIATSSSLNGVDDTADGTDNSTSLNTGTIAAAKNICTDDVLPHLKHKRNYNAKASHIGGLVVVFAIAVLSPSGNACIDGNKCPMEMRKSKFVLSVNAAVTLTESPK